MDRRETVYAGAEVVEVLYHDVSWELIRSKRNQALADSDWRALKDVTLSVPWREYRQALRDLPEHETANDAADNWPVMPDE